MIVTTQNKVTIEIKELPDIRHSALSELANEKRQNINFSHIERLAETFNIEYSGNY